MFFLNLSELSDPPFERSRCGEYYALYINSVGLCEKFQATRAKVHPAKLIYGSHFSGTEATYEVSLVIYNIFYIITIYLQEVDVIRQPSFILSLKYCNA